MPGRIDYVTMDQASTQRGMELMARGEGYRSRGLAEHGLNCERKALRWFEHSFWCRNFGRPNYTPSPLVVSAYASRLA